MTWTGYDYQVAPAVTGGFVDLTDYCTSVRIPTEFMSGLRGGNLVIPYTPGVYSEPNKFLNGVKMALECHVRYTNAGGTVTHPEGAAGHVHENLQALKKIFRPHGEHILIRRDDPENGIVEALCEFKGELKSSGPRMRFTFMVELLEGSWREIPAVTTHQELNIVSFPHNFTIATGGDAIIWDPTITITCDTAGNNPELSLDVNGDTITIQDALITSDVYILDLRTKTFTKNASQAINNIARNRAWYMRLPSNDATLDMTFDATGGQFDVELDWNDRWL